jgi:CheY-like chemotaxis protein
VGNAIKFTEKGEVMLHVQVASVENDETVLQFTIGDTGIGIAAEKLSMIFDKFTQADTSTSRKYGGTGLGLAITRRLIEMMGGKIWVESKEGQGSAFHFTLSFTVQAGKNFPRLMPDMIFENSRILVVEDNKSTREYLTEMLRHFKMKAVAVTNGRAALVELTRAMRLHQPYSIVLLDISLPGQIDGYDVAEAIKQDESLKDTEIIVLTISQKASDKLRFALLGVTQFFSKPFNQSGLIDSIQNILTGNKNLLGKDYAAHDHAHAHNALYVVTQKGNLKILLAEDNKVNQEVALSMLTKQGYEVYIANNGEEAVTALQKEPFDLVLMDVQMPVMNGYEATQKIRLIEKQTNSRIPIIGLTANAMNGDREKCIDAGMDEYLSKPVNMRGLLATIDKLSGGTSSISPQLSANGPANGLEIDHEKLLYKLGGSKRVLASCLGLFHSEVPILLSTIDAALACKDAEEIKIACHTLRGSLVTMEMISASSMAASIEHSASDENFDEIKTLLIALKKEIAKAVEQINALL